MTIPNTELLIHRNSIANCLCFEARIPENHVSGRDCFVQSPKPIPIPKSFQSPNRFINTFQHHCESHMGCTRDSESVLSLSPRCLSVVSPLSRCCLSEVSPGLSAVPFQSDKVNALFSLLSLPSSLFDPSLEPLPESLRRGFGYVIVSF